MEALTEERVAEVYHGVYGWSKRCLYLVLFSLTLIVMVNLCLLIWIMKVLHSNTAQNGLDGMQLVEGGIQISGKAIVQDTLLASAVFPRSGKTLSILSYKNMTLRTTDLTGDMASNIYLGDGKFEINTPSFIVSEEPSRTLFSVDEDAVSVIAQPLLEMSREGGTVLGGGLHTSLVSAEIRSDLVLESLTKEVKAVTPAGVTIISNAGEILASGNQISLLAVDGYIKLEASNVVICNLPYPKSRQPWPKHHHLQRIYQLCILSNGHLYLGDPDSFCDTDLNSDVCQS